MKVLQLNIWGGRLGKQIIELLRREDADVVCFQEAIDVPGGYSFLFEDLNDIVTRAEYPYHNFLPQFGYKLMKRHAKSGLAILSKTEFLKTHSTFTRLEYIDDFDLLDTDYNIRSIQHAVVEYGDKILNVLNHHGYHLPDHKNGDEETMRQCGILVDYIQKLEGPTVLCGDFNLVPDSESIQKIDRVLINHVKEHGILSTRTPLTHKTEACDYIFTSPGLEVTDFQVLDDIVSDHKALTMEFK